MKLKVQDIFPSVESVTHLVLLHGIIEVTNFKTHIAYRNDLKSCQRQFIVLLHTISDMLFLKKIFFHPL